jgi:hypothetical protein
MENQEQSDKVQETENSLISYRAFRNILIVLALSLSYLMGKFFRVQDTKTPNRAGIHYTINK